MRVGVEEAGHEDLLERRARERLATAFGSMPAATSAATSVILMAVTSDRVSDRSPVRSHTTTGAVTLGSSAKSAANRSAFAASCR